MIDASVLLNKVCEWIEFHSEFRVTGYEVGVEQTLDALTLIFTMEHQDGSEPIGARINVTPMILEQSTPAAVGEILMHAAEDERAAKRMFAGYKPKPAPEPQIPNEGW